MPSSSSDDDDCLCRICRFQCGTDLPVPSISSLDDLRCQARSLSINIFRDWVLLNKILKRFEGQIRKRWMKRNNAQRIKVLQEAWPSMAPTHRPDFAPLRRVGTNNNKCRPNRERERNAYLWPYINIEDLVQPYNLLLFLNSRGRSLPDKFAFSDHISAHNGNVESNKLQDVGDHRMSLHGAHSPKSYGALVPCKANVEFQDRIRMHPIAGLQVLQIQARVLSFLVDCCRIILHDVDLKTLNRLPTKPVPLAVLSSVPYWPTITAIASEAPYRLPQKLDLERLGMLINAKREESEEHMWTLREDPGYFAQELKEWAEHSPKMITDKFKKQHSSIGKSDFWKEVAQEMITHAYRNVVFFATADNAMAEAQAKLKAHKYETSNRLPSSIERSLREVDYLIEYMCNEPLTDLVYGFPASPSMRNGFERSVTKANENFHQLKLTLGKSSPVWRVHVLFRTLLSEDQQDKHGLSNIVEEIQRVLDENSKDSGLISRWVADRFSDLALLSECKRQLDLFQPWSAGWRSDASDASRPKYLRYFELQDTVCDVIHCAYLQDANPAKFAYPSEKRRSLETVNKMRAAEKKLDKFWDLIDMHCEDHTGSPVNILLMDLLKDWNRRLQRTDSWVEPKSRGWDAPSVLQHNHPHKQNQATKDGIPLHKLDPNARCSQPTRKSLLDGMSPFKVKTKTRPAEPLKVQEKAKPRAGSAIEIEIVKIKVNRRAYRVFSTLFHVPSANEQQCQGEVAWSEFLYAMSSIGFSPEKLYGSSWQFTPTAIDAKRSIQIHEPHPHAKLHYWLAKRTGRRLHRAFGWDGETFVLTK